MEKEFDNLRYFTGGIYPCDKCSICKINRKDEFGKLKWNTDLLIKDCLHSRDIKVLTVCPKCRELPLNIIYKKLIDDMASSKKNEVENG